jgi:hypothetical protein
MPKQDTLVFGLAAIWGICATWIYQWLEVPVIGVVFWASEPTVKSLLQDGWTTDQIRPYLLWATHVFPALFYGLIFGFPLGLLIERSIIVTWAIFVAAFVATVAVKTSLAKVAILTLAGWLMHPMYWLMALAILFFSFLGRRVRSAYVLHRTAA